MKIPSAVTKLTLPNKYEKDKTDLGEFLKDLSSLPYILTEPLKPFRMISISFFFIYFY